MKQRTLKQEIKDLKMGYKKQFKIDYEDKYIVAQKSKLKGLELYFFDEWHDEIRVMSYEEIPNNFTEFSLYDQSKIDY